MTQLTAFCKTFDNRSDYIYTHIHSHSASFRHRDPLDTQWLAITDSNAATVMELEEHSYAKKTLWAVPFLSDSPQVTKAVYCKESYGALQLNKVPVNMGNTNYMKEAEYNTAHLTEITQHRSAIAVLLQKYIPIAKSLYCRIMLTNPVCLTVKLILKKFCQARFLRIQKVVASWE